MKYLLAAVVLAVAGFGAWVRLAPTPAARWQVDPETAPAPGIGGFRQTLDLAAPPRTVLEKLDAVARSTPRTRRIAGSIKEGRLTYETRSRLWRFPDYTTVQAVPSGNGTRLTILGRLRFGRGDLGVNRARIRRWIKDAELVPDPVVE